ncbi:cell division protein FtsL [Caldichromatium japonicum]|uniref:Cell division protein FtsL n=1 Tax=Caldichromatium japonicum TaxID=2699430 RepID=A0A6G7VEI6_9GAMM|nr:cell division protein FtsL [Caldichromatium japonicum]QIK38384.1 cell division protein FtsL [Caldichromatium japonicum]
MTHARMLVILSLIAAVLSTAMAVIYVKYLTRIHFVRLQELRAQRDAIDIEWNRLRLEEAALSTHVLVERKARRELGMFAPRAGDVLLIEGPGHDQP